MHFFCGDVTDEDGVHNSGEMDLRSKRLLHAMFGVVLLASLVNLGLFVSNSNTAWSLYRSGILSSYNSAISPLTHENDDLKRPNVYTGLDKLPSDVAHAALPDNLVIFPSLFHPIDYRHPDRIFPDDELARFTFNGRVSPVDRHVLLTEEVCLTSHLARTRLTTGHCTDIDGGTIPGSGLWHGTLSNRFFDTVDDHPGRIGYSLRFAGKHKLSPSLESHYAGRAQLRVRRPHAVSIYETSPRTTSCAF